jgi:HPt (histidine-containing phosphotransfer) domain-containing protein
MSFPAPGSSDKGDPEAPPSAAKAKEPAVALLDRRCTDEIRRLERGLGQKDLLSGFVLTLERNLAAFGAAFDKCIASGDAKGATRAAHTLKGACSQLGVQALGELFADIESSANAGDYDDAKRRFLAGAGLIERSLQVLKQA